MALPPLPPGLKPLHHQVAGHKYGEGKTGLGCLQTNDGLMLKPVQRAPKGPRELQFYVTMNDNNILSNSSLLKLRDFMPKFYGTYKDQDTVYIRLEDCASAFKQPNIMDVKMGGILYHPEYVKNDLSEAEIELAYKKFVPGREYGYSMLGMRMYDLNLNDFTTIDKHYLRKLHQEEVIISKGLECFFNKIPHRRNALLKSTLKGVEEINDWFESQSQLTFYSSSLLLVYEGDPSPSPAKIQNGNCHRNDDIHNGQDEIRNNCGICNSVEDAHEDGGILDGRKNGCTNGGHNCDKLGLENCDVDQQTKRGFEPNCDSSDKVLIKMIDFTHTYFENKKDENYLLGLRTLIKHLKMMLQTQ